MAQESYLKYKLYHQLLLFQNCTLATTCCPATITYFNLKTDTMMANSLWQNLERCILGHINLWSSNHLPSNSVLPIIEYQSWSPSRSTACSKSTMWPTRSSSITCFSRNGEINFGVWKDFQGLSSTSILTLLVALLGLGFPWSEARTCIARSPKPRHDKTNNVAVRPAKTDQLRHPPSLIRVFAVRSMGS